MAIDPNSLSSSLRSLVVNRYGEVDMEKLREVAESFVYSPAIKNEAAMLLSGNKAWGDIGDQFVSKIPYNQPPEAETPLDIITSDKIKASEIEEILFPIREDEEEVSDSEVIYKVKQLLNSKFLRHVAADVYKDADGVSLESKFGRRIAKEMVLIAMFVYDGDYSADKMRSLSKLALRNPSSLKDVPNFDYEGYRLYKEECIKNDNRIDKSNEDEDEVKIHKLKMPLEIAGIKRIEISPDNRELK